MNLKIFSILDKKAMAYAPPFISHNKGEALRVLDDLTNDKQTNISKHPSDYSLWLIGDWDYRTGLITPLLKPEFLEEAGNYVKKETQPNA